MKDSRIPKDNSLTNAYKQGKVGEHPKIGDNRLNLKKFGFKVKEVKKESSEIQEKMDADLTAINENRSPLSNNAG